MGIIGRVTNNQISDNFLLDLNRNQRSLADVQRTVASGKRVLQASDDPVAASQAVRLRAELTRIDAWQANIDDGVTWTQAADAALGSAGDIMQRVRDLAMQGANGAMSPAARANLAQEVSQLRSQLVQVGNTNIAGKYIFAGTTTDVAPFDPTTFAATVPISTGAITREIGAGATVQVNITAGQFQGPGGPTPDIFTLLGQIATDLQSGAIGAVSSALDDIDAHISNMSTQRAVVGGAQNRMEIARDQLEQARITMSEQISANEDADMAGAITDLTTRETALRAALSVGSRLLPNSLLDFLRS